MLLFFRLTATVLNNIGSKVVLFICVVIAAFEFRFYHALIIR